MTRRALPVPRGLAPALAIAVSPWLAGSARADEPPVPSRVVLVRPGCAATELDEAELVRLLEIELRADGVETVEAIGGDQVDAQTVAPAAGTSLAVLRLEGVCTAGAPISVTIDDAATDKRVRREVDLRGVGDDARPRAVALATAELLRASWLELVLPSAPPPKAAVPLVVRDAARGRAAAATMPKPPAPEPLPPVALEPAPLAPASAPPSPAPVAPPDAATDAADDAAAARTAETFWLGGSAGARGFVDGNAVFGSGRAEVMFPVAHPIRGRAGLVAGYSPGETILGDIDLLVVTARGALALSLVRQSFLLEIGPFVELGWGYANGTPSQALIASDDASAFIVVTGATIGARLALSGPLWLDASGDFGPTLSGLSALSAGVEARGIEGFSAGGQVGLAWAL